MVLDQQVIVDFEYRTKLRHDTINNHIDDVISSIEKQMTKYINE